MLTSYRGRKKIDSNNSRSRRAIQHSSPDVFSGILLSAARYAEIQADPDMARYIGRHGSKIPYHREGARITGRRSYIIVRRGDHCSGACDLIPSKGQLCEEDPFLALEFCMHVHFIGYCYCHYFQHLQSAHMDRDY